ncbi:MAG: IclR family transcriptional regulator [Tistlia sp.]|uniref:IclR family transcriptional regulator n=1 Tax=Tistlia sp. TaxID=3057121 RepID=UPI0034A449DD
MSQTIDRALDVLDCFREGGAFSLSELGARSGLSVSTVHRIVAVLERRGVLIRDPRSQQYMVGPDLVAIAARADTVAQITALARPLLAELRDGCGETSVLSLLVGDRRVAVEQCESSHQLRRSVDLGRPLELHFGSAGKAMLAHLPDAERERLLRGLPPLGHTPFTHTDPQALRAELEGIRRRGFAVSKNEYLIGVTSLGAAVFNRDGAVVAALSVTGPLSRLTPNLYGKVGAATAAMAQKLTHALAGPGAADSTATAAVRSA